MNDLITAATSGLFVEVGKVIEHMKAQQTRIADLERQLAEAAPPACLIEPVVMPQKVHVHHIAAIAKCSGIFGLVSMSEIQKFALALLNEFSTAEASAPAVEQQPVAYLRFRAAQQWSGVGGHDIEHNEWLETCHAHEIGDNKMPAFPVYAAPHAADTDKVREALASIGAARIDAVWEAMPGGLNGFLKQFGYQQFAYAILDLASDVIEIEARKSANMAAQAPVREVPGWVSVKDSLPTEQRKEYLVWCSSNKCWYTAMLDYENKWRYFAGQEGLIEEEVTHWMLLPAAPIQQEGDRG